MKIQFKYKPNVSPVLWLSLSLLVITLQFIFKAPVVECNENSIKQNKTQCIDINEDVLVLSSWDSIKYWTSSSSLHSSKAIQSSKQLNSNELKVFSIDLYINQTNGEKVLFWCELMSQTLFSAVIEMNNENPFLSQTKRLLQMDFGSHIRFAVNSVDERIYLSLHQFSRIDVFYVNNKESKVFLSNISKPVDIAVDGNQQILFWVENWSCISQTNISDINVTKMCSLNARAIAVDGPNSQLYWSDSDGSIYRRNYFERTAHLVFTAKKMQQNYALDVTNGAIYLSDRYKLLSIDKKTFTDKVVLIESPGIIDFKAIMKSDCIQVRQETALVTHIDSTYTSESFIADTTFASNIIAINESLINSEINSNNENNYMFTRNTIIIITFVSFLIILSLILLTIICFKRLFRRESRKRKQIKRINGTLKNKFNDRNRLLKSGPNVGKTLCIEDLGSFSNNSYLDSQQFCQSCPIRQTCSSCEDRDECLERGICLTTYKLLS